MIEAGGVVDAGVDPEEGLSSSSPPVGVAGGCCWVGVGASEVRSVVDSASGVDGGWGEGVDGEDGGGGGGRDVGEGVEGAGDAPVPLACRFSPWCR